MHSIKLGLWRQPPYSTLVTSWLSSHLSSCWFRPFQWPIWIVPIWEDPGMNIRHWLWRHHSTSWIIWWFSQKKTFKKAPWNVAPACPNILSQWINSKFSICEFAQNSNNMVQDSVGYGDALAWIRLACAPCPALWKAVLISSVCPLGSWVSATAGCVSPARLIFYVDFY